MGGVDAGDPHRAGVLVDAAPHDLHHQRVAIRAHAEQPAGHRVDAQLGIDRLDVVRRNRAPEGAFDGGLVDVHAALTSASAATSLRSHTSNASAANDEQAMTTASIAA